MENVLNIKIFALIESIRPLTTLLGLAGAYIGGIVAGASYFSFPLILAMIVVFLIGAGSMPFNDYYDRDVDKISHPERPIPSKRLKPYEALYFSLILFGFALTVSFFINPLCFSIVVFSLLFLYLYEKYLKNQGFIGNVLVAFLSAMSFTFGGAAVGNPLASILLSLIAFFLFTGREMLKDVQDVEGDLLSRKTLPMKIGEKNAAIVGSIFLIIAICITPFPYFMNQLKIQYLIFISIVDIICIFGIYQTLMDLKKTENTISLLRIASAIGIIAIIIGAI